MKLPYHVFFCRICRQYSKVLVEAVMEEIGAAVAEKLEFEERVESKLIALSGFFGLTGF